MWVDNKAETQLIGQKADFIRERGANKSRFAFVFIRQRVARVRHYAEPLQRANEHQEELLARERFAGTQTLSHSERHEVPCARRSEWPVFQAACEVGVWIKMVGVRPNVGLVLHCHWFGNTIVPAGIKYSLIWVQRFMGQSEWSDWEKRYTSFMTASVNGSKWRSS